MVMNTNPDMENGAANTAGMTNAPAGRISLMEAIEQRHSVRQYQDKPLPANVMPVNSILESVPFKTVIGYRQDTCDPKEPDTHSITPPSSTTARLVFRLYMFFHQFSMVE